MRRSLRISGIGLLAFLLLLSAVLANLAIVYQLSAPGIVSIGICLALDLMAVAALVSVALGTRRRALLAYAAA